MKSFKQIALFLIALILMASFSQCSTAQKLQTEPPMAHGEVYAQQWTAGVKEGGSGINVFIPIETKTITLDSMYFRHRSVKLEYTNGENPMYIGRFKTSFNQAEDMVISSDMTEESKNPYPDKEDIPFELEDNECVVSYKKGNRSYYYKISDITIKQPIHYPSAPKKGQ